MPHINCQLLTALALLFGFYAPSFARSSSAPSAETKVRTIMAAWHDDTPPWKDRMRAMVWCAKAGPSVIDHLTKMLKLSTRPQRLFAAEALALFAGPKTRQTLIPFLEKEEHTKVMRVFTDKTIHYLGHVQPTRVPARQVMRKPKDGVRPLLTWAWQREKHNGTFAALQKQLANYDLAKMDSAGWCRPAPDFALRDVSGKTRRLSHFRGKKHVVLVFIDTQT